MNYLITNRFLIFLIFISLFTGFYIALTNSYGYDNDTYRMLNTFLNLIHNGIYIPSRSPGSPVAELGIGTLAWFGGSKLTNSFTLILFLSSISLFPFAFKKDFKYQNYLLFLCLCLTSLLLLFENTHSIDYSWALFFFTLGAFLKFRTKYNYLSIICFVLAVGSRSIYALYIIPISLIHLNIDYKEKLSQRITYLITCIFCSSLIFVPVWYLNNLSLNWITTVYPDQQGLFGIFARFFYKNIMNFGVIQSLIIVVFIFKNLSNRIKTSGLKENNFLTLLSIIIINLLIFLKIPAEPMYMQISIVSTYFILAYGFEFEKINKFFLIFIISMNLFSWYKNIDILKIQYATDNPCSIFAVDAKPNLYLKDGKINWLLEKNKNINCYYKSLSNIKGIDYSERILNGSKLNH